MAYSFDDLVEREHRRWTRENAHLWNRPDAHRFLRPDAERFLRPGDKLDRYWEKPEYQSPAMRAYAKPPAPGRVAGYAQDLSFAGAVAPVPESEPSHGELLKLKSDLAALWVQLAVIKHEIATRKARGLPPLTEADEGWQIILKGLARFQDACRKAGFNPAQPRVPAGNPDGGQWTSGGSNTGGGSAGQWVRLAASDKPSLGRGTIATILTQAAKQAIDAYRKSNYLWDLFGGKIGTVAVTRIDDSDLFGSNSTSPTYTNADRAAAVRLREKLLEKYPDIMNVEEIGKRPNDALFHAETTVLTRAARASGGSLAGRRFDVHVDRKMCLGCSEILPLIGLELGDPTVTFIDQKRTRRTMKNGSWIAEGDQ